MTDPWLELVERFVSASERIASALEGEHVAPRPKPKRTESRRRGLRVTRSETVVPTDLDRARAAKALKRLGYLGNDDKT